MEQELVRTGLNGSALVGMLAQLALIDPPAAAPSFVEGMGRWLGWKEAIPLSAVLQQAAPGAVVAVSAARASNPGGNANADAWGRELSRVQAALTLTIEQDGHTAREDGHDFLPFRRLCVGLQQNMGSTLSPLREQLRTAVAKRSPEWARLAALDAVLSQALAPREQALLALLPVLLEKHFLRLRPVQPSGTAAPGPTAPNPPWLDRFRHDMRQLLLAELDLRLQPSLGLLATLRSA